MNTRLQAEMQRSWSYYEQLGAYVPRASSKPASGANIRSQPGSRLLIRADIVDLRRELELFHPSWNEQARSHLDPQYCVTVSALTGYVCPHCRMPSLLGWPNRGVIRCAEHYQGCGTAWRGESDWLRLESMLEDQRAALEVVHVYGEPQLRRRGSAGRFEQREAQEAG